jgi:hypothetical protein
MLFDAVVLAPLDKIADELEVDEDAEEDSVFIPFPLTTKLVQPPPYRGTDPEWQEYIKFSKDPALAKRIRGMQLLLQYGGISDDQQMIWQRLSRQQSRGLRW